MWIAFALSEAEILWTSSDNFIDRRSTKTEVFCHTRILHRARGVDARLDVWIVEERDADSLLEAVFAAARRNVYGRFDDFLPPWEWMESLPGDCIFIEAYLFVTASLNLFDKYL